MNDKAREAFEAWTTEAGRWPAAVKRDGRGQYLLAQTASAWTAWQAALQWAASQQSAPEGWRLVPVEPTEAMLTPPEGMVLDQTMAPLWRRGRVLTWQDMLAAAPTAQAPDAWQCPKCGIERAGPLIACKQAGCPTAPTAQGERNEP